MVFDLLRLDRQEGARADVERQRLAADPARFEGFEQARSEMQRRGRGGHRAFLPGEHRLIVGAVRLIRRAAGSDVGRQRHPPGALEQELDRLLPMEMQQRRAVGGFLHDRRMDILAEVDDVAGMRPLRVAQERLPFARAFALVQRGADARLSPAAFELGGDHLGVVEDQHVAGPQQVRQVEDVAVRNLGAADDQQSRAVARAGGA